MTWSGVFRRWEPVLLLLASGCCIGSIFPLGKMAAELGVGVLVYVGATAAGASVVLACLSVLSGHALRPDRTGAMYALVAGQLTFAAPWGIMVAVMPHLGSGMTAIVQSLTPIFTLAMAYAVALERSNLRKSMGIALGLAGTLVLIVEQKGARTDNAALFWIAAALLGPALLALGNVFRTMHWPTGRAPIVLATWALAAAAAGIAVAGAAYAILFGARGMQLSSNLGWKLMLVQSLATGCGYAFMFRLQQVGGPIFLSQLSYVNTAVGVVFAMFLFSEVLSTAAWFALALTIAGIVLAADRQQ